MPLALRDVSGKPTAKKKKKKLPRDGMEYKCFMKHANVKTSTEIVQCVQLKE